MSDDTKRWSQVAARLRRALGLAPPSLAEADAEMTEAQEVPMSDKQIRAIVNAATGTNTVGSFDPEPDYGWTSEFAGDEVADEMLVLNREAGEEDPEVDQRIEELRQEALHDDDEEDDETRLEGDGA